jgi:hypothetical protein
VRRALLLALGLTLAGCAVAPTGPAPRPTLEEAVARLPSTAAGLYRGASTVHETANPGLGIGVDYAAPGRGAVATVTLYDRGAAEPVPDDAEAPAIAAEFERAVEEVLAAGAVRRTHRLALAERVTAPVEGGEGLRCAVLRGRYGRDPVVSTLCLGGAAGRFLRVQVTMPDRSPPPADALGFTGAVAAAARGGRA